jgi:hypothetical protein
VIIATHPVNLEWARDKYGDEVYEYRTSCFIPMRNRGWKWPVDRFIEFDDRDRRWLQGLGMNTYDRGPLVYVLNSACQPISDALKLPKRVRDDLEGSSPSILDRLAARKSDRDFLRSSMRCHAIVRDLLNRWGLPCEAAA